VPRKRRGAAAPRGAGLPAGPRPERVEEAADGDWVVRAVPGATGSGSKTYRCPGCDQEIRPATPHVVSWPAYPRDSDLEPWDTASAADLRRHWHTACWRARDRRR
jgi:hypothetical protein